MIDEKKLIEAFEKWHDSIENSMSGDFVRSILKVVIGKIKGQPKVGEWIPCSEKLPEDETLLYWTTHEDGSLVLHGYKKRNGFICNWEVDDLDKRKRQGQVIAWIPIFEPAPYNADMRKKVE